MQSTGHSVQLDQFSSLVHQVYAASAEPSRWIETVGAVALAMGAKQAILFTPYSGLDGGLMFPWQVREQDLTRYVSKYINHDLWAINAQRKGLIRDGAVALDEDLVPQIELLDSVYYREFLKPMGVGRLCSGVVFEGAPGLPSTVLSIYRGPDDPFGPKERDLMRLLVPHLSRSLGLMHRLNHARYQAESLRGALNRLTMGVFLLDSNMAVTFANTKAQEVLDRADGLQLDAQQRLTTMGLLKPDDQRLEAWLAQLVAISELQRGSFRDTFEVSRSKSETRYSLQCFALEANDPLASQEGVRHVVFVTDPMKLELPTSDQMQRQFGLTPAEARAMLAIVQGGSYMDVAKRLAISEETVRTQIKSVYAKTQTIDKASLTRLVLSLGKAIV